MGISGQERSFTMTSRLYLKKYTPLTLKSLKIECEFRKIQIQFLILKIRQNLNQFNLYKNKKRVFVYNKQNLYLIRKNKPALFE